MKIAIIGYYGYNNFGDEINLLEMIKLIKAQYPKAAVTVFSRSLWHTFMKPEYRLVPAAGIPLDDFRKTLNGYDLIIVGGGGLIYLGAHFFTFLDKNITVPYIFSRVGIDDRTVKPQTVQKIKSVLQKADSITVRTKGDLALLKKHFSMSCDVVPEAIWNYQTQTLNLPSSTKRVLVSLNVYAGQFVDAIRTSFKSIRPIYEYIMSMQDTTTDSYYNIKATNQKTRIVIPDSIGLDGKGRYLASVDLTITSRLHAALVSISHGIPALMLKSTPKLEFLAKELELTPWYCSHVTGTLIEKVLDEKEAKRQSLMGITDKMRNGASAYIIP